MKSAHARVAATILGIASALAGPASTMAQGYGAAATAPPDAPFTRWLYGLDGSRSPSELRGSMNEPGEPLGPMTGPSERYGSPADGMPYDHAISLRPDTRSIAVVHNETVKFITPSGREFRWRFDTLRTVDVFPLVRITPADVPLSSNVAVYVNGDLPKDRS
jgi:heavy-metal resistance protein CzcE